LHTRTRAAGALAGILAVASSLLVPFAAQAAEGPPPPSMEHRVLAKVHTDAVSTFLNDDGFVLGTKADIADGPGTRFDPATTILHIDDASKQTVPTGFEFIGAPGSEVWVAPERSPSGADGYDQLWPGFSTESLPAGAVVNDATTFTLDSLDGPGALELYTGGIGSIKRLWSSDDGIQSFTIGRTHMHANWAFTEPGRYTLGVRADAVTKTGPVSATSTYTVVVGALAPAVTTATTVSVDTVSPVAGAPVELSATVSPSGAVGYIEFLDGETSLGHDEVVAGGATLSVPSLSVGAHPIMARFVPALLNDFQASGSQATSIQVTQNAGAEPFDITGGRSSYVSGDAIDLRVTGVTLADGESFRWIIRANESETEYVIPGLDGARFERDATAGFDGAQLAVEHRGMAGGRGVTLAQTDWTTIVVTGDNTGSGEPVNLTAGTSSSYVGDQVVVTIEHPTLADGQSLAWVSRVLPYGLDWAEPWSMPVLAEDGSYLFPAASLASAELALRVIDVDGTVIGQSPAISVEVEQREIQLAGLRTVYRVGDVLELSSSVYPARQNLAYEWAFGGQSWDTIADESASTLRLTVTEEMNGRPLILSVFDDETGEWIGQAEADIRVTDAAAGDQLVLIDSLSGHYHQNNTIDLRASADPVAADTDTYHWSWKRPDQTAFEPIPGASGAATAVRAQQALDGTLVMVELRSAEGDLLASSETSTIEIDDHGALPTEKAQIEGLVDQYREGDSIELGAVVTPNSVLDRWEWVVQHANGALAAPLEGQHGSSLTLPATTDLDGASVVARLTFDDGAGYIDSAPVALRVLPAVGQPALPADPAATAPGASGPSSDAHAPGSSIDDSRYFGDDLAQSGSEWVPGLLTAGILFVLGLIAWLSRPRLASSAAIRPRE
jgi:surface-anchored protein